ncbi:hypothetical protein ACNVED_04325 [Legionella sp. D16C41]|uniref:hypothetical protein n=1 Tax=Legionella sp. D16C41 TaxID=3402688 RepID=UPI003AF566B5
MQSNQEIQQKLDQAKEQTATNSIISSEINDEDELLLTVNQKLAWQSFLLVNEEGYIFKAITESKNENFLMPPKMEKIKDKPYFAYAFMEVEVTMQDTKKAHLLIIKPREKDGTSKHNDLYAIGANLLKKYYFDKLGIKEIRDKTLSQGGYAVTGECEDVSILSKKDFQRKEPVHLRDLNIRFNTKGTISEAYKPFTTVANQKDLTPEQVKEKRQEYDTLKGENKINLCPELHTYIPDENWVLHEDWDVDLNLNSPTRKRLNPLKEQVLQEDMSLDNASLLQSNTSNQSLNNNQELDNPSDNFKQVIKKDDITYSALRTHGFMGIGSRNNIITKRQSSRSAPYSINKRPSDDKSETRETESNASQNSCNNS